MADKTLINNELLYNNSTVINPSVQNSVSATVLNPVTSREVNVNIGQSLFGKYTVVKKMDIITGEADLYLCEYNNAQFVAKLYRRKVAIKPEVSHKLMNINSKYVAKIYETGEINGFPTEIIPYYRYGSLQGRKYTYQQLKEHIIPSLNEGLKVLHDNGIYHKDLKPSNIMIADNQKDVAIIDFGISSAREDNNTVIVTKTGMTPEYSAPETFRNLFLEESDYYSLGITLYELFCGYTPYKNMSPEAIEQYSLVQRVPFPDNMPEDLQNLIAACTYYDITNRKNKSNPNRRWTYEEVKKWCNGDKQIIPGEGIGNARVGDMNQYKFMGETYVEVAKLTKALALNWNDGKKQLFRGILSGFFKSSNPDLAGYCIDAEEEAARINGKDDIIFWKLLYKLNPNTTDFYWKGHVYQGLPALGREILEKLWKDDTSNDSFYYEILSEKMLSRYVSLKVENNNVLSDAVKGLEDSYKISNNQRDKKKNLYLMGYMLSGQKLMHIEGKDFRTVGELADYMKELLDETYEKFEALCHKLIDYDDNLDVQLESWLLALGKKKEIEVWREGLK
jgi:serine/threonine protein kinase